MDGTADMTPQDTEPDGDGSATFGCPRCGGRVEESYYGPCTSCRADLRATVSSEARDVDDVGYEPKMNVTPNAVALKD